MDISVLLALDTAAFQQGLQAAADALGQFKAGADVCFEALGKAQAKIDEAADAAAKEAAKVTEAASAAKAKAEAELEAAKATSAASQSSAEAADKAEDLGKELGKAKGAMGVVGGAAAALQGDFQGMVGGTMQAANGLRALGVSMQTAMKATVVLAVVAAVVSLAKAIADAREKAERFKEAIRLDNLAASVDSAASHFRLLAGQMERAVALAKGLDDASGLARRIEQERQLAQLEKERNEALLAGGDAGVVNRTFDARRRELEFSFKRDESADAVSDIRREREQNAARREALAEQEAELRSQSWRYYDEAQAAYRKGGAGFLERLGRGDFTNSSNEEYVAKGKELGARSSELGNEANRILEQIMALEAEDRVLAARLEAEQGRGDVIRLQEEAAALAAAIQEKGSSEPEKEPPPKEAADGSWGSLQTTSDRLARIGGFVGGSNLMQNHAREQLQVARRQQQLLEQIERNTSGGQEAAILA